MLNKLYYVFGVDTGCFYTDAEMLTDVQLNCFRQIKNLLRSKKQTTTHAKLEQSIINQNIKTYKDKLKSQIAENIDLTRTARYESFFDRNHQPAMTKRISIFDSTLTRVLGLKEREFNDEIMVIKVYYFDIAHSIVKNGFYFNGEKYVFFSSSAGQIRTKKLVVVKERLLQEAWNTLTAGLSIENINTQGGMNVN